jgi:hypothetical protein
MKLDMRENLVTELKKFGVYTLILTFFFSAFTLYRRLILEEYALDFTNYGFNLVKSMILAKIILLGQALNLGQTFSGPPLIIPTAYKTIIFSIFVVAFAVVEHFTMGFLEGKSWETLYQALADKRMVQILAALLPMSFFFFFFFAFLELQNFMPEKKILNLFFKKPQRN